MHEIDDKQVGGLQVIFLSKPESEQLKERLSIKYDIQQRHKWQIRPDLDH